MSKSDSLANLGRLRIAEKYGFQERFKASCFPGHLICEDSLESAPNYSI
jgi:hypothetical protein